METNPDSQQWKASKTGEVLHLDSGYDVAVCGVGPLLEPADNKSYRGRCQRCLATGEVLSDRPEP